MSFPRNHLQRFPVVDLYTSNQPNLTETVIRLENTYRQHRRKYLMYCRPCRDRTCEHLIKSQLFVLNVDAPKHLLLLASYGNRQSLSNSICLATLEKHLRLSVLALIFQNRGITESGTSDSIGQCTSQDQRQVLDLMAGRAGIEPATR